MEFKHENNVDRETESILLGTCKSMCPQDEVAMREKVRMVHILEVSPNGEKSLVKCYSRSAADSLMAVPHLLRPYKVLKDTVKHLIFVVTKRNDVSTPVLYDFVNDRLRAVRQDMTIQRLPSHQCTGLLEPMIRFYVYYGYKLCQCPIKEYDPVLNKKYLLECLKWYLSSWEALDRTEKTKNNGDLSKKQIIDNMECPLGSRELMESLYILSNLDNIHPIARYWTLSKELKRSKPVKLAYEVAAANSRGNFVRVCRLLGRLCPLAFCAVCLYLPVLQRRALLVLSAAYASKQRAVPAAALRRWLAAPSDAELMRACAHYGLAADGDGVKFAKDFKVDAALHEPIKPLMLEEKMNLSIDHIFKYEVR